VERGGALRTAGQGSGQEFGLREGRKIWNDREGSKTDAKALKKQKTEWHVGSTTTKFGS